MAIFHSRTSKRVTPIENKNNISPKSVRVAAVNADGVAVQDNPLLWISQLANGNEKAVSHALSNLTHIDDKTTCQAITDEGGVEAIVTTLARHPRHRLIQQDGMTVLCHLSTVSEALQRMADMNVHVLLLDFLEGTGLYHWQWHGALLVQSPHTVSCVLTILRHLAGHHSTIQLQCRQQGLEGCVTKLLEWFPNDSGLQTTAQAAIAAIAPPRRRSTHKKKRAPAPPRRQSRDYEIIAI